MTVAESSGSRKERRAAREAELPKTVAGWEGLYRQAQMLLEHDDETGNASAIRLLDRAVGIRISGRTGFARGETLSAATGCRCLPVHVVRRVEFEAGARRLNWSEMRIAAMQSLLADGLYRGDVRDAEGGVGYLMRATLSGGRYAEHALRWLAPERARGLSTLQGAGRREYLRAIRAGERERAVEMGRMLTGGELGRTGGRADATFMLKMGSAEQKGTAANNIGYLLVHGAAGVGEDGGLEAEATEATEYYKMAIEWGSAAAANNLGFLYYSGAAGVAQDGEAARRYYELAIERGERDYAPRNLGVLLQRGLGGVRADVGAAARCFLLGIGEGDVAARAKCRRSLRSLLWSWRMRFVGAELRRQCVMAVQEDGEADGGNRFGM